MLQVSPETFGIILDLAVMPSSLFEACAVGMQSRGAFPVGYNVTEHFVERGGQTTI